MTGPARAVDVLGTVVSPESLSALRLNGCAVIAMYHFVLGTPETVARLTLLVDTVRLAFFGAGNVAPKTATTNGGIAPASVMVEDDFFAASAPVGRMVHGGAKAEYGFDDGFEKTAATTSAHSVLVCWGGFWASTQRSAWFRNFPARTDFFCKE
jgi:hypothetical protein